MENPLSQKKWSNIKTESNKHFSQNKRWKSSAKEHSEKVADSLWTARLSEGFNNQIKLFYGQDPVVAF